MIEFPLASAVDIVPEVSALAIGTKTFDMLRQRMQEGPAKGQGQER